MDPTRLLCLWDSPGKNTGVGCYFLLQGDLPNPGGLPEDPQIGPRSPALQADFLPSEPQGKPVGCQISDQGEQGATLLNDLESRHSKRDREGQKEAWVVCTPKKLGHEKVFS